MLKLRFMVVVMVAGGWGCGTVVEVAPMVEQTLVVSGVDFERLERGRQVYLTDCAQCHRPEPVMRYSRVEWEEILPRMIAESGLSREAADAVTAYVRWVQESLERGVRGGA